MTFPSHCQKGFARSEGQMTANHFRTQPLPRLPHQIALPYRDATASYHQVKTVDGFLKTPSQFVNVVSDRLKNCTVQHRTLSTPLRLPKRLSFGLDRWKALL